MIYGYESTTSRSINRNPVFKVPVPVPPLVLSESRKSSSPPSPPAVKIDYRSHVLKGINLSTQTVLIMADTESIIDLLHSLDRSYAYLRATSSTITISATTTNNNTTISNNIAGGYNHSSSSSSLPNSMRIHQHGVTPLSLRGGNSRLFAFIEAANPTRSFLDLSQALDEPVEEVS